jgi:hypothetical protein
MVDDRESRVAGGGVCMMARSADAGSTRIPFGIDLAVGSVVASSVVAVVLFPEVAARLVVLTVPLVVYASVVDDPRAGLATAGLGYLVFNGFLVNRYGELTWDGTPSVWHLAMFVLAVGVGLAWRAIRSPWRRAQVASDDHHDRLPATSTEADHDRVVSPVRDGLRDGGALRAAVSRVRRFDKHRVFGHR